MRCAAEKRRITAVHYHNAEIPAQKSPPNATGLIAGEKLILGFPFSTRQLKTAGQLMSTTIAAIFRFASEDMRLPHFQSQKPCLDAWPRDPKAPECRALPALPCHEFAK
jgi:hypothetical protein